MPTNVSYEYIAAEKKFHEAKTNAEKIKALEEMLRKAPSHKGGDKLKNQLKQRLAKLKKLQVRAKKLGKGKGFAIKKEGAAQVVFIGLPNSGKSTVLSELSGEKVRIADYPFTTKQPEVRMIPYENVWLQGIEIPAFYEGFSKNPKSGMLLGLIRNADFIVLVVNGSDNPREAINTLVKELKEANISNKIIIIYTRQLAHLKIKFDQFYYLDKEKIIRTIWYRLNKIKVQTRTHGKIARKPITLKKGATIKDMAGIVHKDFLRKFKHAKVWGNSAAFPGQTCGLQHKLKDGDIVEIFIR